MNYFLALIVLGLYGVGYYELSILQKQNDALTQQIHDLGGAMGTLEAQSRKTDDDELRLKSDLANLATQLQATQSAFTEVKKQALATETPSKPAVIPKPPPPKPPPASNDLGTITTTDGKTYPECHLLKVEANTIVFTYPDGIMEIPYTLMEPKLQKRFGYDPHQGTTLPDAQIQYEEEQRQAANETSGADY